MTEIRLITVSNLNADCRSLATAQSLTGFVNADHNAVMIRLSDLIVYYGPDGAAWLRTSNLREGDVQFESENALRWVIHLGMCQYGIQNAAPCKMNGQTIILPRDPETGKKRKLMVLKNEQTRLSLIYM
jgi:hypothetical protein